MAVVDGEMAVFFHTQVFVRGISVWDVNSRWWNLRLLQGVFNFLLAETLNDFGRSLIGLLGSAVATFTRPSRKGKRTSDVLASRVVLALVLAAIQALVLVIILCPVVVLDMFGMYISAGVGLWRLIEHDFGNADGVAQGVFFGYKTIHGYGAKVGLAEFIADKIGSPWPRLKEHWSVDKRIILDYLESTLAGCEKDPSFASGMNLVTYGMKLMVEAKSNDGFLAGIKVLGTSVSRAERNVLAKHLLTSSASFTHTIQRLLEILGPRSPYSGEIREHGARIVLVVAGFIRLEQFPGGIQCISSLLDTFEEYRWVPEEYERHGCLPTDYERDWLLDANEREYATGHGKRTNSTADSTSPKSDSDFRDYYELLVLGGFLILQKLTVREENCKVICNTEGLLLKIKGEPLISNQPHRNYHDIWLYIKRASLGLMIRLMATPGKTGRNLQRKITGNTEAFIRTLESIVECGRCSVTLKRLAVQILLDLSPVNQASIFNSGSSRGCMVPITWILLYIFLLSDDYFNTILGSIHWKNKLSHIRRLAGEKPSDLFFPYIELSAMLLLQSGGSITSMLLSARIVVGDLTKALIVAGNISIRLHAAQILEDLCWHCLKNDEYLKELKKAMVDVMPQKYLVTAPQGKRSSSQDIIDLESGAFPDSNAQENTSSRQQKGEQPKAKKVLRALVDLCRKIWLEWYRRDTDLTRRLDEIAEKVCSEQGKPVKNFEELVDQAGELLNKLEKEEE
ncbi:hypothetical protein EJB05_01224, partial [Eragrostis curvula]